MLGKGKDLESALFVKKNFEIWKRLLPVPISLITMGNSDIFKKTSQPLHAFESLNLQSIAFMFLEECQDTYLRSLFSHSLEIYQRTCPCFRP